MARLEVRCIDKTYQTSEGKILDHISLTIDDGELFFLLGPSGCGKSTLLRILAGLVTPDSGKILLDGTDITELPPERRNMPMVFQNYALWPHMTVQENIAFPLKSLKLTGKEIAARTAEMLETVQMSAFAKRAVTSLSGGQQQRIALARALALNPGVLLLDEPLSNLDAKLRDAMRFEIRRICKERKLTAIYVTHDRKEALSMADRIALLEHGKVSQTGTPREVYLHPASISAASFLGDVNLLKGVCKTVNTNEGSAFFDTACGRLEAALGENQPQPDVNKEYTLAVRPENIRCEAPGNMPNSFTAVLEKSAFLGESSYRTVKLATGAELNINEYAGAERSPGAVMQIAIPPQNLRILEG